MIIYEDSVEVDILASTLYITDDEANEVGISTEEFEEIIKAYQKWKDENSR